MADYYEYFDKIANNGYVFDGDMSSMATVLAHLTTEEAKERRTWNKKFKKIKEHYLNRPSPEVLSKEGVLQQRLLAPIMEPSNVTRRTGLTEQRDCRLPPPSQLRRWNVVADIATYKLSKTRMKNAIAREFEVFAGMLLAGKDGGIRSEETELTYLITGLNFLKTAKIVGNIERETGLVGRPDFSLKGNKNRLGLVVEGKSTHNLLIPESAGTFIQKYGAVYQAVIVNSGERTVEWGHIAHPFGQLLAYLVDNEHRYGALTSATRTIFVYISGSGAHIKVNISDPYYIGEANYLRAWAYVFSLGCKQRDGFKHPKNGRQKWTKAGTNSPTPQPSPSPQPQNKGTGKRNRESSNNQVSTKRGKTTSAKLPTVDFYDLVIENEIGVGRNGSVFQVSWKGKEYAMKQFDTGKDGSTRFEKEVAAYERTEDLWGELVPRPYFVSETPSGGVKLLGLQLGSSVDSSVDGNGNSVWKKWQEAHAILERDYGIRHNDSSCGANSIFISDANGKRQLAIIDFESWEDLFA